MPQLIRGIFEPSVQFTLTEAKSENGAVIGKVVGQFFVPDGYSRNERWYPRKLWERALVSKEVQERLSSRRMIGTIGHFTPIDDKAIAEGKISHIVTKLWIDEKGRGMGEAEILNTPAGHVLKTLLEAGVKLYVSSRGYGSFKGNDPTGKYPALDPDTYILETFDFVYDPGFLQAKPELVEQLRESLDKCYDDFCKLFDSKINQQKEDYDMGLEKVVESLTKEKQLLTEEIQKMKEEIDKLNAELRAKEGQERELKTKLEEKERLIESLQNQVNETQSQLQDYEIRLEEYKKFEEEVGTPEEVRKALDLARIELERLKEFKEKVGDFDEVREAMESAVEQLERLKEFEERVGSLEEVEKTLVTVKSYLENRLEEQEKEKIEELARKFGVKESVIERFRSKGMTFEEISEILKETHESISVRSKYTVGNKRTESTEPSDDSGYKVDRLRRLAESLTK